MNIQSTNRATTVQPPTQSEPTGDQVIVAVAESSNPITDVFIRGCLGAAKGTLYGALTNSAGWGATTLTGAVGGAVNGGYRGRLYGKKIDGILAGFPKAGEYNFARKEMLKGGLAGLADGALETGLISAMTQLSGGHLAAGTLTGAILGMVDVF